MQQVRDEGEDLVSAGVSRRVGGNEGAVAGPLSHAAPKTQDIMSTKDEMADSEARAEAAYAAMYEARPHNAKDCYEDACHHLAQAIQIAARLGLTAEVARLENRGKEIDAVYNSQFRYVGRS